jgi:DNA repair exonuclease SbcCD ATPase subunit
MRFAAILLVVVSHSIAVDASLAAAAPSPADDSACARLLPEIEKLEAMLTQQTKVGAADTEAPTFVCWVSIASSFSISGSNRAQVGAADTEARRMQLVTTMLGLRYHNLESLQSSFRAAESEENDIRGTVVRAQSQLDALGEAAKSASAQEPDAQHKAQKTEIEANLKGLEERAKGLRDRKANLQGQLALERHDIDKLEAIIRGWIDGSP